MRFGPLICPRPSQVCKSTMRGRGSALLLWAVASVHAQTGSITLVESDKAFEHEVMGSDACC